MTAVLKAQLYRFRKQKSSFVILIIGLIFASVMAFSVGALLGNTPLAVKIQEMVAASVQNSGNIYNQAMNAEILDMIANYELSSIAAYISIGLSGDLLFILFLFIIYFTNATIRNGYLKTILPNIRRSWLFFSDAIILLGYTVVLVLIYLIVFSLFSPLFFVNVPFGNTVSFVIFVILKILLLFVSGLCIIMTTDLFIKRPRMIIVSALYITMISGIFYNLLNVIAKALFGSGAEAGYILPMGALTLLNYGNTVSYISGLIVSVVYLVLCVLVEVLVIPKKDLI